MSEKSLPLAASVLLLRRAETGDDPFEIYMLRRPDLARFAPGAYIFPGGVLDARDRAVASEVLDPASGPAIAELHRRMADKERFAVRDGATAAALLVCAVRELFEEAGVLLARGADGDYLDLGNQRHWAALREEVLAERLDFADLLAEEQAQVLPDDLVYFSHWITPEGLPIRFDTHFFLAELPESQDASHYPGETAGGLWLAPAEGLRRHARGEFRMFPVQRAHLERLAGFESLDELFAFGRAKRVPAVLPVMGAEGREEPLGEGLDRCW